MKIIFAFLAVACVCLAVNDTDWQEYKKKYEKNYPDEKEETYRRGAYDENMKKIEEHNKKYEKKEVTWFMGVNNFTDMTPDEVMKLHTGLTIDEWNDETSEESHEEHHDESHENVTTPTDNDDNGASMLKLSSIIAGLAIVFSIIFN